jgi:hypothetical protein
MSENLGGFRSSPAGFAGGLLTFPGIGLYLVVTPDHACRLQARGVAAGMNPAAPATR